MQGVLLIDKPKTWTSFDVVNFVRKQVAAATGQKPKNTKVGHCGTLDPAATGLLIIVIGKEYTRRAAEFSKLDKAYDVTMRLGETSTTGDSEGQITVVSGVVPDERAVQQALATFTGDSMQTPPAFSALKVNGKRAYDLARQGKPVHLEPRSVTIYDNRYDSYDYPHVRFVSHVSSGTYIRSLVADIGTQLATGAYMADLRRLSIGHFLLQDAVDVRDEQLLQHIIQL